MSFIISAYKVDIESKRDTGWTWTMILDALKKAGAELPAGFNTQKLSLAYKRTERYRIQQRELPDITVDLIAAPVAYTATVVKAGADVQIPAQKRTVQEMVQAAKEAAAAKELKKAEESEESEYYEEVDLT